MDVWLRSSHRKRSIKKGVLENFLKFTGKHLCQSLFFNKVAGLKFLQAATLLKNKLWHSCFPVNFRNILRAPFLQNISGQLLLMVLNNALITVIYVLDHPLNW